jgi:hypothetical protein
MSNRARGARVLDRLAGIIIGKVRRLNHQAFYRLGESIQFQRAASRWQDCANRSRSLCGRSLRSRSLRGRPLETLEPRMLLAADFVFDAIADVAQGFDVTLTSTATHLQIVSNDDGEILKSQALSDNSGRVLILGSASDEKLTIDDSIPAELRVNFNAKSGHDELVGPARDSTWIVTITDRGSLNRNIRFYGVEDLTGAANNQDTFSIGSRGRISGTVDGGDGGFDTLVLDGGQFDTVSYTATAPDAGTVSRNSNMITYAGLEPITDNTTSPSKVITLTNDDNNATLSENAAGQLVLSDDDGTPGTFEGITFNKPTSSLTINLAELGPLGFGDDGKDKVTIESIDLGAADLTILAETITRARCVGVLCSA